jgi:hypothetical protein
MRKSTKLHFVPVLNKCEHGILPNELIKISSNIDILSYGMLRITVWYVVTVKQSKKT